jgi:hypothetical protein
MKQLHLLARTNSIKHIQTKLASSVTLKQILGSPSFVVFSALVLLCSKVSLIIMD